MRKQVCLTLTLLFAIVSVNFAQYGRPRKNKTAEQRAEWAANRLEKALTLTAEQKSTVQAAHLEMEKVMDDLRAQRKAKTLDATGYKAKRKEVRKVRNDKIKGALDAKQKKKYRKLRKKMRERWKARRANRKAKKKDGTVTDDTLDDEDLDDDGGE